MFDVVVETERAVAERHVAHVVPVGDVDVVLGEHGAHGGAQQRREMAGQRRDQQHARLRHVDVLLEMQERTERRDMGRNLAHLDLAVADHDAVDAERGPRVREAGAGDQFVGRGEIANHAVPRAADRRPADRLRSETGQRSHRAHHVVMGLIGLIEHSPTTASLGGRPFAMQKA